MQWCTDYEEKEKRRRLDEEIRNARKRLAAEVKLLLLGTGNSGKSTLAKQMKIIHMSGFTIAERNRYRAVIASNIIVSMKTLVRECKARTTSLDSQNMDAAERIQQHSDTPRTLTLETFRDIKDLWADPAIQQAFKNASMFYIIDNIKHYFDDIDRIMAAGYVPNDEDILKSRATTNGIYETEFDIAHAHFRMIDVGGQRSERRKWIHCFDGVQAVLFCVSMSEYDQVLMEDETMMRMQESLALFREVCDSTWFAETTIILFLNKEDLFREKITRVPLTKCFPEYTGPNDYQSASEYIRSKFVALVEPTSKRLIYPHFTTATNTQNITAVFNAVRDIVLRTHLIRNA